MTGSFTLSSCHLVILSNMPPTLITFARQPIAGRTKTRLCPPLDRALAAGLYACFLRDVLDNMRRVPDVRRVIAYTPESDGAFFAALAPDSPHGRSAVRAWANGWIMRFGIRSTKDEGRKMCWPSSFVVRPSSVLIGSDSPDLPGEYLCEAFRRLERDADVVLGPADDGGYYLIGLRAPQPRLLHEVPMSTPTVLADTLALACELGLRAELLPTWYDIDTVAELRRLAAALRSALPDVAPHTRAFLSDLELSIEL